MDNSETLRKLEAALTTIPRETGAVFIAVRLSGLSYDEIARRTGLTVPQIERHVAKAVCQIDKHLNPAPSHNRWSHLKLAGRVRGFLGGGRSSAQPSSGRLGEVSEASPGTEN